jgi:hypothetical protein
VTQTAWPNGSSAWFSGCQRYRYRLGRSWADGWQPPVTFIMLNPSTADAQVDDPTIRRCVAYTKAWGHSRLVVVNLYALRSTDPRGLWKASDPVGPYNDDHLAAAAEDAELAGSPLVAAWGAHAKPERVAQVLQLPGMDRLTALGVTKSGAPRHPLYLRADLTPEPWQPLAGEVTGMTQLALLDVTTGDDTTDRIVAMLRGVQAAMRQPAPRRDGCDVHRAEVAWFYDPTAPVEEQLALAIQSAYIAWVEALKFEAVRPCPD